MSETISLIDETEFSTREAWLMTAIEHMRPWFEEAGSTLPELIRVSTGWSKRARSGSIGWTWISDVAEDKVNNVFISPELDDPIKVLSTLMHELVHVADDCQNGHGAAFKALATALGLTGKMTATVPSDELTDQLEALVCIIGDYPHAKMVVGGAGKGSGPKTQTTRMLKVVCEASGGDYKVRMTRKMIEEYGLPVCPCHGEEMVETI